MNEENFSLEFSPNAINVLNRRYLKKESGKTIEVPEDMFKRVANNIASAEKIYNPDIKDDELKKIEDKFYRLLTSLDFLPNSPTLMNAGRELQQLSACFVLPVEDSMEGIFETIKNAAIIHKSGGGCIAKGSKIYTSFCGLEDIDILYEKLSERKKISQFDNGEYFDIDKDDIFTYSFNKYTGSFEKDRVLKIWKYNLPVDEIYSILGEGNIKLTTSSWHPFFVFEDGKIKTKRADEIKTGDNLITANYSLLDQWFYQEYYKTSNLIIDEDFSYLVGYFLGDGSIGRYKDKLRLRFFDENRYVLENIVKILQKFTDIKYSIQKDNRCKTLYVVCYNQELIKNLLDLTGVNPGEKSKEITIPAFVWKSPLSVVYSFVAGLFDSDGYVVHNKIKLTYSTSSEEFSIELKSLLHLLGFTPSIRKRKSKKKNWSEIYEVGIEGLNQIKRFVNICGDYLINRKINIYSKGIHTAKACSFDFSLLEKILNEAGINTKNTPVWRKSISIGNRKFFLARWKQGKGVSLDKVLDIIDMLLSFDSLSSNSRNYLNTLRFVLPSLIKVTRIEKAVDVSEFYDLTVENNKNYLAGKNGIAVIHNTGFSFSRLRPKDDRVKTTGGVASGPISFMKVFNSATEAVKQGGTRRGANMGILRVDHPDILEFITSKQDTRELTNFNISVAITEKFMEAVKNDTEYELINPHTKDNTKKLKARDVFNLIVESAWRTGEPGIIFIDRVNRDNPTPALGEIESTNPCGEQPLLPYEACNLGSINLANMIKIEDEKPEIDYEHLKDVVHLSVRFLDNVIDMNKYPLDSIDKMAKVNRKIGLGVMGFADMLIQLDIPYNTESALEIGSKVMEFIEKESKITSGYLSKERGTFPNFFDSVYHKQGSAPLRNATTTTIAPTGTLSIIADCSSGIEPIFALSYIRRVMDKTEMLEVNKYFEKIAKEKGFYSDDIMKKIASKGSIKDIDGIPENLKKIFVTAHDITPEWHVKMQSAFQKFTDNAVSKTVNFPASATKEDVSEVYFLAYREGCKGVTVYRDKSRDEQVLSTGKKEEKHDMISHASGVLQTQTSEENKIVPRARPQVTVGQTQKIGTGCGNFYVTVNEDTKGLFEIFAHMGKSGGCAASQTEAISRLVSLALRSGVEIEAILKQLKGIRCPSPYWDKGNIILSCPDAIAKAVERYLKNGNSKKFEYITESEHHHNTDSSNNSNRKNISGMCPDCSNILEYVEDCVICRFCGYTKCG